MGPWEFGVNIFIALFALIDPVGMVPLFAAATSAAPAAAQRGMAARRGTAARRGGARSARPSR